MPSPKTAIVIVFTAWFLIAAFSVPVNAQDCNNNGILDACDIACGAVAGPCDVPGCGGSQDCNNNGIPDECEFQSSSALDFDGLDDWVRVPRDVSLEPTNDLTIEAWVRANSAGSFHSKILRITGDFGPGYMFS